MFIIDNFLNLLTNTLLSVIFSTYKEVYPMDWENIKNTIVNWFSANWWNIVSAILIFVVGVIVVKVLLSLISKFLSKTKLEKAAQGFVRTVLKFVLWLILILVV